MIQGSSISKDYFINNQKRLQVFNNINFTIERNEKVGFLGLNGSGKSTICKIISQSEPISSGELKISSSISWPIGIYNCLKESLTAIENIRFISIAYGIDSKKISEQIEYYAELKGFMSNPIKTYSAGMRAKLAFFIAFSIEFDFYICDEITSVGDVSFRKKAQEFFDTIVKDKGLILCSPNSENIKKNVDKVYVVYNGGLSEKLDVSDGLQFYEKIRLNKNEK